MLKRLQRWLTRHIVRLPGFQNYIAETRDTMRTQSRLLSDMSADQSSYRADYIERAAELVEARAMCGSGPWLTEANRSAIVTGKMELQEADPLKLKEDISPGAIGAYGDIELALQNVEWRRDINLSWLEFSRWGIQQIMMISRLYYIKNPLIRRGIDIASVYVFGRGCEVTTNDEAANETLKDFFERNRSVLGQIALTDLERRKYYDGNLFFAFFPDTKNTGQVNIRTFDATEIQDIITDPDDADSPQYYRRLWTQRNVDLKTGSVTMSTKQAWYPALGYEPTEKPQTLGTYPIMWDTPILHRKCGGVSKWLFGCPLVYPAIDWAKAARKFLESCATLKQSLAQIAWKITTKGGQQAIEGIKQGLSTTVGPPTNAWDTNPTPTDASYMVTGTGTQLEMFNASGKGGDPEEVRKFIHMVAMVFGLPETFFADVESGNLATAQTLDRPTELNFNEKQETWREDLTTIAAYVLKVSYGAPSGRLREAHRDKLPVILECARRMLPNGEWVYEAFKPTAKAGIQIRVNFPSIREADNPAMVKAIVEAMTLDNKQGAVVGIDEKTGVRLLLEQLGVEDPEAILNEMYPEKEYDPDRTAEPEPEPQPQPGADPVPQNGGPKSTKEARRLITRALEHLVSL